jgi:hypothetical protein
MTVTERLTRLDTGAVIEHRDGVDLGPPLRIPVDGLPFVASQSAAI